MFFEFKSGKKHVLEIEIARHYLGSICVLLPLHILHILHIKTNKNPTEHKMDGLWIYGWVTWGEEFYINYVSG